MNKRKIASKLLKKGFKRKDIAKALNIGTAKLNAFISHLPSQTRVSYLLKNPDFKIKFKKLYYSDLTINQIIVELSKEKYFKKKSISPGGVIRLRNFYGFKKRMHENHYHCKEDRIKGYIIRNVKYSAKRRNLDFNLHFTDIELPTHCPLLGIKLEYLQEGNSNSRNHASLDRIDNSKGYIKGNVIVLSRLANAMKNEASFKELSLFSKNINKIIKHYKNQDALGSITDVFPKINLKT